MKMQFDTDIATKVGTNAAILYDHLDFWCRKNSTKKTGTNFHEGYYWTYESVSKMCNRFPFWSESQVRRMLAKLQVSDLILVSNFNKTSFDRTKWYTTTSSISGHPILQKIELVWTIFLPEIPIMVSGMLIIVMTDAIIRELVMQALQLSQNSIISPYINAYPMTAEIVKIDLVIISPAE